MSPEAAIRPHQQALLQAIELTDEILALLEQGEFNRIDQIDALRQPLIKQAFSASIEQIDLIRARHLQNLNQQVVDRLSLLKESVMQQQAQLRKASKATQAYTNHGSRS